MSKRNQLPQGGANVVFLVSWRLKLPAKMKTNCSFSHPWISSIAILGDSTPFCFRVVGGIFLASFRMGTNEDNEETEDRSTWRLKIIDPEKDSVSTCKLCHRGAQKEDSDLRLGPLYSYGFCQAHHYCLMFRL